MNVPVLLYHSVADDPVAAMAPFTVTPAVFAHQLDVIDEAGMTSVSVADLASAIGARDPGLLPARPVVVAFDDGLADFAEAALPLLAERGRTATLYVTTGFLGGGDARSASRHLPRSRMLSWSQLPELAASGVELGAHSHTHPQLDTLPVRRLRDELVRPKALLEERLGQEVPGVAYPHGFADQRVRALAREVGYGFACAVGNRMASLTGDLFGIERLTVLATTSLHDLRSWIDGRAPRGLAGREPLRTTCYRTYRRVQSRLRPGSARIGW